MKQNQIEIQDDRKTQQVSAHSIKTIHTGRSGPTLGRSWRGPEELQNSSDNDGRSGISFSQFEGMSFMYERQTQKNTPFAVSKKSVPTSKKSIKSQSLIEPPIECKSPEVKGIPNISKVVSEPNISLTFDFKNITESAIFANFLQFSQKKKMSLVSSTPSKITVKNETPFYKKILKVCFPNNLLQSDVYQFKKSSTINGRIKMLLITGDQKQFEQFWKEYTYQLWKQGFLQCSLVEDIHYFLVQQKIQFLKNQANLSIQKIKTAETQLWKKYQSKGNIEENNNMAPIVERLFLNEFYEGIKIAKIIEESVLGDKTVGEIERKKMIIKGSLNLKEILGYLQLKDDLTEVVSKLQDKQLGKIIFPKSVDILNNLTTQKIPSPYQWDLILSNFQHTVKEETKWYNKNQVKDLVFDQKLLKKLLVLLLVQCKNREIWGIIKTLSIFYTPDPCPQHILRLQVLFHILEAGFCSLP